MADGFKENSTDFIWTTIYKRKMKLDRIPDVTGVCFFFGEPFLIINSPHYLNDLYINKNATITKDKDAVKLWKNVFYEAMVFDATTDPHYI